MVRASGKAPGQGEASHTTAPVLYAVLRCGSFRCAIDAIRIEGFDAASCIEGLASTGALRDDQAIADPGALPLGARLGLRSMLASGRRPEQVRITGMDRPLLVDEVEGIVNPGQAGVMKLPALSRMVRPIFKAVLQLSSGAIVPVLDLQEIETLDAEARA